MDVYLIHFERALKHAGHYLGSAEDPSKRLARHRRGQGARLLAVLNEKNISFKIVRVWRGAGRAFERKLKDAGHNNKLCPICFPDTWQKRGLK